MFVYKPQVVGAKLQDDDVIHRGPAAGRRCAGHRAAGSRLGRALAGLHSRCASGLRLAAPGLAGPIDSLARVSRRGSKACDNRLRTQGASGRPTPTWPGTAAATGDGCDRQGAPAGRALPLREAAGRWRAQPVAPSSAGRPARPLPVSRLSDQPPPPVAGPGWPEEPQPPGCPAGRRRRAREKCTRPDGEAPTGPPPGEGEQGRGGHCASWLR
ncbi:uncharacterized protein LOC110983851 [Acanthaster planci]|uniref:Uncharacterized protein LOC110983851 n=1 Tax=Acanthaster planci TaxID=133434 RepID=A0A8B7Z0L5_ACAPL|nr:uncharacterized protein LOC110983851 [Acanthaster planci]